METFDDWANLATGCFVTLGVVLEVISWKKRISKITKQRLKTCDKICFIAGAILFWVTYYTGNKASEEMRSQTVALLPQRQPITSISATAYFQVRGTNRIDFDPVKNEMFVTLQFGRSEYTISNIWKVKLNCKAFKFLGNEESSVYYIEFGHDLMAPAWNLGKDDTIGSADDWDMAILQAFFLRGRTEILGGSVALTLNSVIVKKFEIPKQIGTFTEGNPPLMPHTSLSNVPVRIISSY